MRTKSDRIFDKDKDLFSFIAPNLLPVKCGNKTKNCIRADLYQQIDKHYGANILLERFYLVNSLEIYFSFVSKI